MKILLAALAYTLLSAEPSGQPAKTQPAKPMPESAAKAGTAPKTEMVFLAPEDITWGDPMPGLPKGVKSAVLSGDPTKAAPFTVRLNMPKGYKVPAHWHSKDERFTVLSGNVKLYMGKDFNAPFHTMTAGAFHATPAESRHAAEAMEESIVQIDGVGPFDIHYVNPADDPRKQASR